MAHLKITLFASFQITLNGRSLTDFATDKARALLIYLIVERHQPHRRESLAALLWPDQPDARARQSLRQALSNLRQVLNDDEAPCPFLLVDRHEVQVNPQAEIWLDVAEFTALAEACRHHRHRQPNTCLPCLRRQDAMLALYPGDFLIGFSPGGSALFDEWALLKREWLHQQAIEALAQLTDFYERRGDLAAARRFAQQQVRLEPWREEAHRQLIRLLAQEGQRSAALAQYEACRRALARELGIAPTAETVALYTAVREATFPNTTGPRPTVSHLPPAVTPFIGRTTECAELAEMLANPDGRLVTLIGPGGIGKSRLALQVAGEHIGLYADGVFWAALGAVQAATLIVPTIAQAIGFALYGKEPPHAQLMAYLREKQMLLVLDGAEHLPEAGEVILALLQNAPGVTLLVTSRQRLALREEWLYAVEGLAYGETVAGDQNPSEAAQLFIHSVQRAHRKFAPNTTDWAALSDICRLVEGMPLALELAAAWVPNRNCADVARALAEDMDVLTASWRNAPERQRSIRATFEHSWALLLPAERLLFARLTVFRGGFNGAAAAQVAGAEPAALARLAAKSLVRQVADCAGDGRCQLHELLRQFGAQKLAEFASETQVTAARHADYYLAFLAAQEPLLKGMGQEEALAAIDMDIANVRQAWDWAVDGLIAGQTAVAAAIDRAQESLFLFYSLRSWYQEGAMAFARAAAAVTETIPNDRLLHGDLLARQARCQEFTAPAEEAVALYQESLACFQAENAEQKAALPLYGLGYMAHIRGDYAEAHRYFMASLARYQQAGDRWGQANVLSSLCLELRRQGRFAEAQAYGLESLTIRRAIGDRRGIASSQNNLGLIYCALGDYPTAETALTESIAICRAIGHTVGTANAVTGMCHVALRAGNVQDAVRFQREALGLFRQVGDLWGVAIAYNNLGQIALENGDLAAAQGLFREGVAVYREAGIKAGLANTLNNLGQACFELGDVTGAAVCWGEALSIALAIGDRPIGLEILVRAAALGEQGKGRIRPLPILSFALREPAMLEETRQLAQAHYVALCTALPPEMVALAEAEAGEWTFTAVAATMLDRLADYASREFPSSA